MLFPLKEKRLFKLIASIIGCLFASAISFNAAYAYTLSGYKWDNSTLQICVEDTVTGKYLTAIDAAFADFNSNTNITLKKTASTNVGWAAFVVNFGDVNWEGITNTYFNPVTKINYKARSRVNKHYTNSATKTNLKVLWEHEICHGLGLGHVSSNKHVMYKSASAAYKNGVKKLTADEKAGINKLY